MMTITVMTLTSMLNKSPMLLLITIISTSMIMSYLVFEMTMDSWGSILLIMVYVSGVMVLFMYVVSLSPMKQTKNNQTKKKSNTALMVALLVLWLNPINMVNQSNKFEGSFEKMMNMNILLIAMLIMMGSIIPKMFMANFKGLKSSK